jgi:hypothetical protein
MSLLPLPSGSDPNSLEFAGRLVQRTLLTIAAAGDALVATFGVAQRALGSLFAVWASREVGAHSGPSHILRDVLLSVLPIQSCRLCARAVRAHGRALRKAGIASATCRQPGCMSHVRSHGRRAHLAHVRTGSTQGVHNTC